MAATTARRPPVKRRPAPQLTAPSQQLAPRPVSWGREATAWVATGIAGFGAAPLLGQPSLAGPVLSIGLLIAMARVVHGIRGAARNQLADRLVEALTPALGLRTPDRRTVQLRSWTHGWPGTPRRVTLRYAPGVDDNDPQWLPSLRTALNRRLLAEYELHRHDHRRCRITLRQMPPGSDVAQKSPALLRAERSVTELLGATASVTDVEWNDNDLAALEVRHEAAVKLSAPGYRHRVERVVQAMLPGRWRAQWDLEADTVRFELRPALPRSVPHPQPTITDSNRYEIPLAVDEDGDTVTWRLRGTGPHLLVIGKTGQGKALAVDTPVPTPHGWTTMGELRAGSTVFDETGAICRVLAAHPVMHERDCYRVRFSDGAEIIADADHLWGTRTRSQRMARWGGRSPSRTWWPQERVSAVQRHAAATAARPDEQITAAQLTKELGADCLNLIQVVAREISPDSYAERTVPRRRAGQRDHTLTVQVPTYSAHRLTKELAARAARPIGAAQVRVIPDNLTVSSTAEIAASVRTCTGHTNHSVPVAGPLQYPAADLPIDPYVLGAWLGDGHSHRAQIYSADPELIRQIEIAGYPCVKVQQNYAYGIRGLQTHLRAAGLLGDKHIPEVYLRASIEQRRALLAGLLDTDGTCGPHDGRVSFVVTRESLARAAFELVLSLGYKPTLIRRPCKGRSEQTSTAYNVGFTPGSDPVFRLTRKAKIQRAAAPRSTARERYIVDVQRVDSVAVRCITVDSPSHLYLAGRHCIPTHNTVLMNGVVMELAFRDWPVWICDPKRIEFLGMRGWPNVQIVATSVPEQVVVIYKAWEEMERRYAQIEAGEASEDDFEPLIVVLDEYRDFYGIVAEWYAGIKITGMPARCPVLEKVSSIVRKGRSARVHLILGTQRPDADVLGGEMRDNFGTRISLGPLSPQGAMMMWENPHLGVSLPRGIAGRATAVSDDSRPLEVQAYWTPDPRRAAHAAHQADLDLLEQLTPARGSHPPLRMHLDEELLLTPDSKGRSQEWAAVMGAELLPAQDWSEEQSPQRPREVLLQSAVESMAPAGRPRLSLVSARAGAATSDAATAAAAVDLDVDEVDRQADFGLGDEAPADDQGFDEQVPADQLVPGDLILIEDSPPTWGRVEAIEPDPSDDELVCLDWRSDEDDSGSLDLPADLLMTVHRAIADLSDADAS